MSYPTILKEYSPRGPNHAFVQSSEHWKELQNGQIKIHPDLDSGLYGLKDLDLLSGRGMFLRRVTAPGFPRALYETTLLWALGIPTRIVMMTQAINGSNEEPRELLPNLTQESIRNGWINVLDRDHGTAFYP